MKKEIIRSLTNNITLVGIVIYLIIMFVYRFNKFTITYTILFLIWLFVQLFFFSDEKLDFKNKPEEGDED